MAKESEQLSPLELSNVEFGIPVGELLELNILPDVELVAGKKGIDKLVRAVTVMEAPDFINWVKKDEFLLTTGYAFANDPSALREIVPSLAKKGLAALGIKPGRFVDSIPEEMIQMADQLNFPIIKIPYHVSFSEIIMPISHAISERLVRYLKLSEKIHNILMRAALEVDGLNYLGKKLYELVDNPLSIRIPSLDLNFDFPDEKNIEDLLSNCSEEKPVKANGDNSLVERQVIKWKGKRIQKSMFSIVAGAEKLGLIIVWELNPLSRLAVLALERSISIVAYEIMKSYAIIAVESRYKNIVVDQLVTSDAQSLENLKQRAKMFGWILKPPFCVIIIQFSDQDTGLQKEQYLDTSHHLVSKLIRRVNGDLIVAEKAGHMIIIATRALIKTELELKETVSEIDNALKTSINKYSYRIGVGRIHRSEQGISLSYEEACKALKVLDQMNNSNIAYFDELGVWRLLSSIQDQKEVNAFIDDILGELIRYDKKYNTNFLETVKMFSEFNHSTSKTAEFFNVHYNTITYRLDRIKHLFNIDLANQHQRLSVELALKFIYNEI